MYGPNCHFSLTTANIPNVRHFPLTACKVVELQTERKEKRSGGKGRPAQRHDVGHFNKKIKENQNKITCVNNSN